MEKKKASKKNLFYMTQEELNAFFESEEGQNVLDGLVNCLETEMEKENKKPHSYMFNQDCSCWGCPYNSHYKKDVEMGEITWCTKYKNSEPDNICSKRNHIEML